MRDQARHEPARTGALLRRSQNSSRSLKPLILNPRHRGAHEQLLSGISGWFSLSISIGAWVPKNLARRSFLLKPSLRRVRFQRTSTRQQLDYAKTPKSRNRENRRTPISDGLSACSRSSPRLHPRGQEFDGDPTRPSPNSHRLKSRGQRHRNAAAILWRNGYEIDLTCHAPIDVMSERGPRLSQVRVTREGVCRDDERQIHTLLC